jgi:membrane fusion protein (multidrug efflux system)
MFRSLAKAGRWIGLRRVLVVIVVLLCAGLVWFNFFRTKMIGEFFAHMTQPPVVVSAAKVEGKTWNPEIRALGTLGAVQGVDVASQVSGVVKSIDFAANDQVKDGQLLVQIDDAVERADLMSAHAAIERDQSAMERATRLRKTGVNSDAALEEASSALAASQSTLAKIQAELDQKAIEAPFAGTIGIPRIDVGQYIEPGTVIATLQRLDTMRVDFTVPEQQFAKLKIGEPAVFGLTEQSFAYQGQIVGVDPKIDPQTRLVSVRAELKNSDGALRPGQLVRVRVELPAEQEVIVLPQTAVVTSLYGDYVYLVVPADTPPTASPANVQSANSSSSASSATDSAASPAAAPGGVPAPAPTPAPVPASAATPSPGPAGQQAGASGERLIARQVFVTTGRRQGNEIEIAKGLEAGQEVITSGQNKLSNNAPVTINNEVDPAKLSEQGAEGET